MIKRKNAILKIGILCIMFFFALSIIVLGDKVNLSTVKVQFANGSEINIFTASISFCGVESPAPEFVYIFNLNLLTCTRNRVYFSYEHETVYFITHYRRN